MFPIPVSPRLARHRLPAHSVVSALALFFTLFLTASQSVIAQQQTPGVVIVTTEEGFTDAFQFASRLSGQGVVSLLYRIEPNTTSRYLDWVTQQALDSLRRRTDVVRSRVGLLVIGSGSPNATWIQKFVRDTSLAFVVTAQDTTSPDDLSLYISARIPVLALRTPTPAFDTLSSVASNITVSEDRRGGPRQVALIQTVGHYVTIWHRPPHGALTNDQDVLPSVVDRVTGWVQRRLGLSTERLPNDLIRVSVLPD